MFKLKLSVFCSISSSRNYSVGLKKKSTVASSYFLLYTAAKVIILSASVTLHILFDFISKASEWCIFKRLAFSASMSKDWNGAVLFNL